MASVFGDDAGDRLRKDIINTQRVNQKVLKKSELSLPPYKSEGKYNEAKRESERKIVCHLFHECLNSDEAGDLLKELQSKMEEIRAKIKEKH